MSQERTDEARPENRRDEVSPVDVEWCYDAVEDVSRTFALTVAELREPMSRDICVGYLLCRVADTVEDAGHIPPAEKHALLRCYERALDPEADATVASFRERIAEWIPEEPNDDWTVVAESPRIARTFEALEPTSKRAIRPPVRELVSGMAMFVDRYADQGGLRLRTLEELEEYCWYAAGTVGTLVTGLLSRNVDPSVRETLHNNARSFALLLQLVNVAKDVAVDYEEENNVYLPQELLDRHGLAVADIADPTRAEAFAPAIRNIVARAEENLDGAQAWLETMPTVRGNSRSAWVIPFLLAVATLRELADRPEDVIATGGVKISRAEVGAIIEAARGGTETDLGRLRERVASRPLGTD